jgi:hypothetical protein
LHLSLAQRLLRDDDVPVLTRLGLSCRMAKILAALSFAQIVKLAITSQVLCVIP